MKKRRLLPHLHHTQRSLPLADKCLLAFLCVLMLQSAHSLFFYELTLPESGTLDVVVRTTAAAIFGYFVSSNFQNGASFASFDAKKEKTDVTLPLDTKNEPACDNFCDRPEQRSSFQILVVAAIGFFSLVILLVARNFFAINPKSIATISQLRDFVSGSVGFLIGHSTHQKNRPD